jgi:Tfp pilus assembly protein PilV
MRARDARGFTLLEAAIAASLLVVVAAGTAQLFAIAARQNRHARDELAMGLLAAAKADELFAAAADPSQRPPPGGALERDVAGFSDIVTDGGARYARRWTVSAAAGHPDLVAIAVRVVPHARAAAPSGGVVIATLAGPLR